MLNDADRDEIRRMIREGVKGTSQIGHLRDPQGGAALTPGGKTGCAVLVQLPMLFILLILGIMVYDAWDEHAWRAEEGEVASIQIMAILVDVQQVSSRARRSWEAVLREERARTAVAGDGAGGRSGMQTDIQTEVKTLDRDRMQILDAIYEANTLPMDHGAMVFEGLQQLQHSFSKWVSIHMETLHHVSHARTSEAPDAAHQGLHAMERMETDYTMALDKLEHHLSDLAGSTQVRARFNAQDRARLLKGQTAVMLILIGIGCLLCLGGMVAVGVLCRARGKAVEE